jgi:hypothetical protein
LTSHIYHPDVHTHGLFPGCPRCKELAASPAQLDQAMRRRLADGHIESFLDLQAAHLLGVDGREV